MDPISNADRLVLILRQRLEERAKAGRAGRAKNPANAQAPNAASAIRALAAVEGGDERPLRRGVIQSLLSEQLGPELVNDAGFQQIVSRVLAAIEGDGDASALLTRVVAELREL